MFALQTRGKDGHTLQDTLEGLLNRARRPERVAELTAELAVPPLPVALRYLWLAFARMRRRKGGGFSGADPLSHGDMAGYMALTGARFMPWEIEIIEALDDLWLDSRLIVD